MKLVTYESAKQSRLGVVQGDFVVDVAAAYGLIAKGRIADAKLAAAAKVLRKLGRPPQDMIELLGLGERYRKALGVVVARAGALGKKGPKGLLIPLRTAKLRAPIAHPNKITCIGLNYADHAREGGQRAAPGADFLPEIAQYHLRPRRSHQAAAQLHARWITKRNSPW